MTAEPSDSGEAALPNGSPPAKRGRGRPKGSLNKTKFNLFPRTITRVPKVVQLFCSAAPAEKSRRPGRPKKKLRGRPRKTPLSPEEEAEIRERQKNIKRHKWKPLGRPRIHPVGHAKKKKGKPGRPGRPRKYLHSPSRASPPAAIAGSPATTAAGPVVKRGRGRPPGSPNKRRASNFSHKKKTTPVPEGAAPPRKRGRPPGSGKIQKKIRQQEADDYSPPRKRGRPPGSKTPKVEKPKSGRKRGRPSGSLGKKKRRELGKSLEDGEQLTLELEEEEEEEVEAGQAATAANGDTESAPVEDEAELGVGDVEEDGAEVVEATAAGGKNSSGKKNAI